jgi:CheY-like chemotaxis protein
MKTNIQTHSSAKPVNVLLVGNNPIEMGNVIEKLNQVRTRKIITEIAFDLKSILERLLHFRPNFILIDDNVGRIELQEAVNALSSNKRTKDIPITVLKNSNYRESLGASSILDYLLKENLSSESLYNTWKNTLRFRRTQLFLHRAFQRKKGLFA